MSVAIVDRSGVLSAELREFTERRLLFALSRFDAKIQRVSVLLADANGPRGGVDKSCRITVTLRRANEVTITDQDADVTACIARAAERAGRAVGRAIERARGFDRPRPQASDSTPRP